MTAVKFEQNPAIKNKFVYQFNHTGRAAALEKSYWLFLPAETTGTLYARTLSKSGTVTMKYRDTTCKVVRDPLLKACDLNLANPPRGEHVFTVRREGKGDEDYTVFFGLSSDTKLP